MSRGPGAAGGAGATAAAGRRPVVRLEGVTVGADLYELDLDVAVGELVAVLDPSGAAGRAVLELVSGRVRPAAGRVLVDGEDRVGTSAAESDVGFVPLAPRPGRHRSVVGAAVPGRRGRRGAERADHRQRAVELLGDLGLASRLGERAARLQAADRWRIALARALATGPRVLLLEEPLASAGGSARSRLGDELRRLQLRLRVPTLVAVADPADALALADRIAVVRDGHVEQVASPDELYERPATAFVAQFVGTMNRIPAVLGDGDVEFLGVRREVLGSAPPPGPAVALVRPEGLLVAADEDGAGRVVTRTFSGATTRLAVALPDGLEVRIDVAGVHSQELTPGTAVTVTPAERPALVAAAEPAEEA